MDSRSSSQSSAPRNALFRTTQSMPVLALWAMNVAVYLVTWDHRRRSRRTLARLDPHLLRDLGIDYAAAQQESERPFWEG